MAKLSTLERAAKSVADKCAACNRCFEDSSTFAQVERKGNIGGVSRGGTTMMVGSNGNSDELQLPDPAYRWLNPRSATATYHLTLENQSNQAFQSQITLHNPKRAQQQVRQAETLYRQYRVPYIDTTQLSVEEIAARMLQRAGIERRVNSL